MQMEPELMARVDASDVVQETLVVIANRLDDFIQRRPTSLRIWMRRKALEQLIDQRRRHLGAEKRSVYKEQRLPDVSSMAIARALFSDTPSRIVSKIELQERVQRATAQLDIKDREVLAMRHAEGLSNAEVADVLQIDPSTARKRHGRALRRLHQRLADSNISLDET
jgi:RNA polymerase sigma-70 factor (ECF subfamily)